jgi:hypothetical protein
MKSALLLLVLVLSLAAIPGSGWAHPDRSIGRCECLQDWRVSEVRGELHLMPICGSIAERTHRWQRTVAAAASPTIVSISRG